MIRLVPTRALRGFASLACCGAMAACCFAAQAQTGEQPAAEPTAASASNVAGGRIAASSTISKHQADAADEAYLAGAKKLGRDDLDGAQHEFERALQLNPNNGTYAVAISVARERRINELVQHASKARLSGDDAAAETLLAEARSIDPQNPMVIEHSGPFVRQAVGRRTAGTGGAVQAAATDGQAASWKMQAQVPADAIRLAPASGVQSFDLRGSSSEVLQNLGHAFGIRVMIDESLEQKTLRFNLQHATYEQAMRTAMDMAHAFAVPIDENSVLVAADSTDNRERLERLMEETVYLPAMTSAQITDLAQVVKTIFNANEKEISVEPALGKMVLRVPQYKLDPVNETLRGLIEGSGEVMLEVKLYEVDKTHELSAGATIPNQFTIFNVDQAADSIVNANQTLVQQAIAQGYITSGTSNLEIALALVQLGLVQSNLATNLIGVFGGGLLRTGVSGSTGATLNLGLNSSDTRTLDYVQLRVDDRQEAIFREGSKYPIALSTYSTGSTASLPASVANAMINGVSVSSLLSQYTGGAGVTIPVVSYENLGVTMDAKPVIEKSGRIDLTIDLKIEALSGSTVGGNPILNSRQFATEMTVADGESALMVSSVNRTESDAISGLPGGLPGVQVPLDDARERDGSQLVIVVTPHVVRRRPNMIAGPRIPIYGAPAED